MEGLRALTICQPWAWAIMAGHKRFENRDWQTDYVGPLVIHAGKSEKWMPDGMAFLRRLGICPLRSELEFGAVLGVVEMVDCVRKAECDGDPFAFGPYCFKLEKPRRLAVPVPMKGQLTLWRIDPAIVAELEIGADAKSQAVASAESREQRIERAIGAAGPGKLRRATQGNLWK